MFHCAIYLIFFFFQAEDGIRDLTVTGVQTCALPISGTQARCRETPADSFGPRRQQDSLRTHLREAAEGGELLELQRALRAQRLIVRCADPRHEGVDVALFYLVVRAPEVEDLARGLELLG